MTAVGAGRRWFLVGNSVVVVGSSSRSSSKSSSSSSNNSSSSSSSSSSTDYSQLWRDVAFPLPRRLCLVTLWPFHYSRFR
ncbi:uncharacterized protein BO97DRAFT_179816 [Aspergillus homomorphus CBS 101889]|uniref:Uncharacterized protein n=1 Tax=Aspergillus homomorphus (strain CBS 101889) TaxID=1450537 RepID=A0A395I770_ASPHC|nr:hypothetical protein BO97DRAFT_179816 [Aspergillus homomorphus CBS 101889]RAL16050.1 hypothetical protein BO97DRAFT_179816 [Aspergillus homomorphus CBS 101889]